MVRIDRLVLGDYQVNCYILHQEGDGRCTVIDPGYEAGKILDFLQENRLHLEAILLTHGHFDHVGAVRELVAETDCSVYMKPEECSMPTQMTAGALYFTHPYPAQFEVAGISFQVLSTPGHTPGSVCLITGDAMFSGDTLFAGSCGRIDFPGGNGAEMLASLQRLKALPGNFRVYPGHGEDTTLERERRYNPYMG